MKKPFIVCVHTNLGQTDYNFDKINFALDFMTTWKSAFLCMPGGGMGVIATYEMQPTPIEAWGNFYVRNGFLINGL